MSSDPTAENLDDYRAYAKQLTTQLEGFARMRRQVRLFPLFALITGVGVTLIGNIGLGAAATGVWLVFWGTTLYITKMRSWQYRDERRLIRDEIEVLQEEKRGDDVLPADSTGASARARAADASAVL